MSERDAAAARAVRDVFSEVPATYELINRVLTFGLDVVWRRRAVKVAAGGRGGEWLDMCSGTGETAVYLSRLAPEGTRVLAADFCPAMMAEARRKPEAKRVEFVPADIRALPFADGSLDLVTMSFATRNVNVSREALIESFAELRRVLKPGGRFVSVETSQPPSSLVRMCFHIYVKLVVERIGALISGYRPGYAMLSSTIRRFYPAEELADIMREAGFGKVTFRRMFFGAAAIHEAEK
jgi:demethylmenaquinone methyltransferase/2-methoxy-6-polyprenyl-1,4-benzoquinol methylase